MRYMDAAGRREKRRVCFIKCKDKGFISIGVVFASDCFHFSWLLIENMCRFFTSFLSFLRNILCFFHFDLESMSPHFLANLARFRRKGVRFLSPAALFSHPRCVVSCQSPRRCSRPSRCLCRPSSAPPPPPACPLARALRAFSEFSFFCLHLFTFRLQSVDL